ncbi:MAG: hypothetical protein HBSAPP03_27500 [Phycisphaerae bacterium]|nr:MAG: hypothetical protein HBSAPP03_27500 [Phycisphaerae bacterium]
MNKVLCIAWREFTSTVFTKGFLLGVVMTPLMILVVAGAIAWMKKFEGPRIRGTVAVIDLSGLVADGLAVKFGPEAEAREAEDRGREAAEGLKQSDLGKAASTMAEASGQDVSKQASAAAANMVRQGPQLTLEVLPRDADADAEKESVKHATVRTHAETPSQGTGDRLALVVIPAGAVQRSGEAFVPYLAFYAQRLDGEVQSRIQRRVADAIIDARLRADERLGSAGLTPSDVRSLVERPRAEARTLTPEGEKNSLGELMMLVPMGFMLLLMISVMTSGSNLLTTTVEEKSNRVMEVLLSAVSPVQLMSGKIIGQMGVGLLILIAYSGLGIGSVAFLLKRLDLITWSSLVYLGVFFIIAYFLIASMMAAIGSAVNDMREAQALMTPVMVIVMIPWLIWFVIQRAPNSPLAVALSFVPGTNPFVMVIRLSGSEPVPAWQIPVSILVGVLSVVGAAWGAAKIFRVGVLMYGKPPDFRTLMRWIRMA